VKGRVLALSRHVYRLQVKDAFYVESESCDSHYYFVRYNPSVSEGCSCFYNSTRGEKCKHIYSIEYGIRFDTIKTVDRLPEEVHIKKDTEKPTIESKCWEEEEYSF